MPTERQSESARINGAKSRGPKSAEGKKKSSRNSLQHGCTAGHTILLACEDRGDFEHMREDYITMYKPVTFEEQNLVAEMFATAWRLRRATTIETALIDLEVVTEEPKLKARFDTVDGGILLASAFRSLADESRSLALVLRYEARLRRIHQQNYDMLLRLRQQRQPEPAPPEPLPPPPAPESVVQADSRPETKGLQNEPRGGTDDRLSSSVTHLRRRFRSRRERKIFNARVVRADSLHDIGIGRRMAAGTPRGIK